MKWSPITACVNVALLLVIGVEAVLLFGPSPGVLNEAPDRVGGTPAGHVELTQHDTAPQPVMQGYNLHTTTSVKAAFESNPLSGPMDWAELSDLYFTHGLYGEALACMGEACRLASESGELAYRHGFLLSQMGMMDEARSEYERALQHGYGEADKCWYLIGRDYLRQEKTALAREAFLNAPELAAAGWQIAKIDFREGRLEEAAQTIATVQEKQPNVFAVNLLRAHIEEALGHDVQAAAFHDLAEYSTQLLDTPVLDFLQTLLLILERHSLSTFIDQQRSMMEKGQPRPAVAAAEGVANGKWHPSIEDLLATGDFSLGNQDRQQERLRQIIEIDSGTTYRFWRLGIALLTAQKYEEALDAFKVGLRLDGQERYQDCRDGLIKTYEQLGDFGRARFHVSRFAYQDGVDSLYRGQVDVARDALEKSVELFPQDANAWYYLGRCRQFLGEREMAIAAYRSCLQWKPTHGRAQTELERLGAGELAE